MSTATDYMRAIGSGPSYLADGSAYWPTRHIGDNLEVFKMLVWRDYLDPDVLALVDQIRAGDITTWDPATAAYSIWLYVNNFPYIAPPAGEELYLPFKAFMARGGGDCDNKTLVSCCLMLAAGIPCRAVVIELQTPTGGHSGQGHMYPEAFVPGFGWVAFDPSQRDTSPWQRDHVIPGWRVAVVDFSGLRPTEAEMNRVIGTGGQIAPPAPGFGNLMATAGLITGMLTGQSVCGPEPTDPTNPNHLALYNQWYDCNQREQEQPGYWETVGGRAQQIVGEGLLGGLSKWLHDKGLAPAPTGGASDLLPIALVGGLAIGAVYLLTRKKRAA